MQASLVVSVVYGAVDAMFVLYLAIVRSFDSIYRGELRLDWADRAAIGWRKAQDDLRRTHIGRILTKSLRRFPTQT